MRKNENSWVVCKAFRVDRVRIDCDTVANEIFFSRSENIDGVSKGFSFVRGCQWAFGRRQYRGSVFGVFEKYVEVWNKFIRLDIEVGYLLLSDII